VVPAPVRAYIDELLPAVLDGTVEPGKVFDLAIDLEQTPDGYRAMDRREVLKTLIRTTWRTASTMDVITYTLGWLSLPPLSPLGT
jgi:hypothetical protein